METDREAANRRAFEAATARMNSFWNNHPTAAGLLAASFFSMAFKLLFYLYYVLAFISMLLGHVLYWLVYVLDFLSHLVFQLAFPGLLLATLGALLIRKDPIHLQVAQLRVEVKVAIRLLTAVFLGQVLLFALGYFLPTGVISPVTFLFLICGGIMVIVQFVQGSLLALGMQSTPQGSRVSVNDPHRDRTENRTGANLLGTSDDNLCVVCMAKPKSVMVKPCNHFALCSDCVRQLDECPVCRGPMTSLERVYS